MKKFHPFLPCLIVLMCIVPKMFIKVEKFISEALLTDFIHNLMYKICRGIVEHGDSYVLSVPMNIFLGLRKRARAFLVDMFQPGWAACQSVGKGKNIDKQFQIRKQVTVIHLVPGMLDAEEFFLGFL
ncbi:hypothetical protein BDR04DRAFT_1115054 [Suillus decipiens]|nr:hypothetical protein BDR04DRAFT_1115054 [Suillus decipiens]